MKPGDTLRKNENPIVKKQHKSLIVNELLSSERKLANFATQQHKLSRTPIKVQEDADD